MSTATKTVHPVDYVNLSKRVRALIYNPRYNDVGPASFLADGVEEKLKAISKVEPNALVCKYSDDSAALFVHVPASMGMDQLNGIVVTVLSSLEG